MDTLADESKLEQDRSDLIPRSTLVLAGIFSWLRWFFTLTEEDRLAAGIDVEGKDILPWVR